MIDNDYEILYLINRRCDLAFEMLILKYKKIIINKLKRFVLDFNLKEDIIQECLIELTNCLKKYSDTYNVLLMTYFCIIIDRKIYKCIKDYSKDTNFKKYIIEDESRVVMDCDLNYNVLIENLVVEDINANVYKQLNDLEIQVYEEIIYGNCNRVYFANKNNLSTKKVYNVTQKVKKKYKDYLINPNNN